MPIGDTLAKLALGQTLGRGEIEELRLQMNMIQEISARTSGVSQGRDWFPVLKAYDATLGKLEVKAGGGGTVDVDGTYKVDNVQVVGSRVVDARCDDTLNSGDATTDGVIDALRDAMITHGLIAAA